jgi:hypothetical protein
MDAAPQLRDMRVKAMSQSRPPPTAADRPARQASALPFFPPPWASAPYFPVLPPAVAGLCRGPPRPRAGAKTPAGPAAGAPTAGPPPCRATAFHQADPGGISPLSAGSRRVREPESGASL